MPLVAFSVRCDRIDESLLFEAKDWSLWSSAVCTYEEDAKGKLIAAQSTPKERFAAGEWGPHIGFLREIRLGRPAAQGDKSRVEILRNARKAEAWRQRESEP